MTPPSMPWWERDEPPTVVDLVGRYAGASNATFLGELGSGERVIYKPIAGETPLWDFPPETLALREVLTYEMDRLLGTHVVPETVLGEGPLGLGAIQRHLDTEPGFDPLPLVQAGAAELWPIAVLDIVTNNADRKLGHLIQAEGRLWAVDHGLTFHPADKLRTVLWGFAGRPIPPQWMAALETVADQLGPAASFGSRVADLLGEGSRFALMARVDHLLVTGVHPAPPTDRPALPWPPY